MLKVDKDKILINRGDIGILGVTATDDNNNPYTFQPGDVIRFKIMYSGDAANVVKQKDVVVVEPLQEVDIELTSEDTTIGSPISTPVNYWYTIELNPDTAQQTIKGYDNKGAKILTLYPEGGHRESGVTE